MAFFFQKNRAKSLEDEILENIDERLALEHQLSKLNPNRPQSDRDFSLIKAVEEGDLDSVRALLSYSDVNYEVEDEYNHNIAVIASRFNHGELISYFYYVKFYIKLFTEDSVPLIFHYACLNKNFRIIKICLREDLINRHLTLTNASVAFDLAVKDEDMELVNLIFEKRNMGENLDRRTILGTLLYLISHNEMGQFRRAISNGNIVDKFDQNLAESLFVLAIMKKNSAALEALVGNAKIFDFIKTLDREALESALQIGIDNQNLTIVNRITQNHEAMLTLTNQKDQK